MKTKNRKKGTGMMFFGFLLLAAALFLTGFNIYDGWRAQREAREAMIQLERWLEEQEEALKNQEEELGTETLLDPSREMPAVEIDGDRYVGILEIPALQLSLPVMEEWDYSKLRRSPCRYEGSVYQNNMVIAGHNYAKHFSPIKNLPVGTEVVFTDMEEHRFCYEIGWTDVLSAESVEEMCSGDWDLTLFTCTYGGNARYAVRCLRK